MRSNVLKQLGIVFQFDKMISHDFTKADWLASEHLFLHSNQADKAREYLWMIIAPVDDAEVSSQQGRDVVAKETQAIVKEFYDLGGRELEQVAAVKLRPFATHISVESYLEPRPNRSTREGPK